jgi:hypothetical protein
LIWLLSPTPSSLNWSSFKRTAGKSCSSTNHVDKHAQIDALFTSPSPKKKSTPKSTNKSRNQINTVNSSSKVNITTQAVDKASSNKVGATRSREVSTLTTDLQDLFSSEFVGNKDRDKNRIGRRLKKI